MNPLVPLLDGPLIEFLVQQSGKASTAQKAGALFGGLLALALVLFFTLGVHLFISFCLKRICEKAGQEAGIIIWIPIAQLIPTFQGREAAAPDDPPDAHSLRGVILLLWNLFQVRGKPPALSLIALFPPAIPFLIAYLAFAD